MKTIGIYLAIYACASALIFQVVYQLQPKAFIDEIFHIPQAQKYCDGKYSEWDNKITTLPGMYIASVMLLKPLQAIFQSITCSVWCLRYINVLYNIINTLLCYNILKKVNSKKDCPNTGFTALMIGTFPVLYFFSFLYYTDPGAVMFVLATYLVSLYDNDKLACVFAVVSIIFRQTNIVWVAFVAGVKAANHLDQVTEISEIAVSDNLKDKLARFFASLVSALVRYLLVLENIFKVSMLVAPYCCVGVAFLIFVFVNNGIVVGDRSSHEAVLHIPQIFYCSLFILFFSFPLLVTFNKLRRFTAFVRHEGALALVCMCCITYSLINYTHVHPYLLADNRHFAFYIWRRLIGHRLLRFLFAPVYLYAVWTINDSLSSSGRSVLWRCAYLICSAAVCIPQKLLEIRYFILPYLIYRLNVRNVSKVRLMSEFVLFCAVNAATLAVFMWKDVHWDDLEDPQKIIW